MSDKIKLNEVIREMLLDAQDPDNYLHGTSETQILFHVRNAYTHHIVSGEMKGAVLSLAIDLVGGWKLPLPKDFIKYVALYGVNNDDGKLHPLFLDNSIITSGGYLLDNNGNLLFDNEGLPLLDRTQTYPAPNSNPANASLDNGVSNGNCASDWYGRRYNIESGVATANGQYKLDKKNNLFTITDSPFDTFVLDYISDPTHYYTNGIGDIWIFKAWKDALKASAYFDIINRRRRVPMNEKQFAELQKDKLVLKAKLTFSPTIKEYTQWLNRQNGGAVNI